MNHVGTAALGCPAERSSAAFRLLGQTAAPPIHTAVLSDAVAPVLPALSAAHLPPRTPSPEILRSINPAPQIPRDLPPERSPRENCFHPIPAMNPPPFPESPPASLRAAPAFSPAADLPSARRLRP